MKRPKSWTKENTIEWVDSTITSFENNYQQSEKSQRVNFRNLCSGWDWAKRSDVYTHYFHKYPAKLLPYIPVFFLASSKSINTPVLDPFGGTGTVAVESIVHHTNPRDCNLVEINPLARLISAAKTTPIDPAILRQQYIELKKIIQASEVKSINLPDFPGIDFWFREEAKKELGIIKDAIQSLGCHVTEKDFFWTCFSSIIRDMSRADPKVSPPVLLSAEKFKGTYKEKIQKLVKRKGAFKAAVLFEKSVNKNIARMQRLWNAWCINGKSARIIGHDARNLTRSPYLGKGNLDLSRERKLPQNSIGMVITSPPYINAQKYTRTTKLELWWLGLIDETSEALSTYDKLLIGTETIYKAEQERLEPVGNPTADTIIEKMKMVDSSKSAIVSKYFSDMRLSLREITRVLKPGGYCVLVVGNNLVLKQQMPNNRILAEIANEEGLLTKSMLVDEIRSRGLITKRHDTAGIIADEWIIMLQKPTNPTKSTEK